MSSSYPFLVTLTPLAKSFKNIGLTVASQLSGLQGFPWSNIQTSNSSAQPDPSSCIFDIPLLHIPCSSGAENIHMYNRTHKNTLLLFLSYRIHSHFKENTRVQSKKTKGESPSPVSSPSIPIPITDLVPVSLHPLSFLQ